MLLVMLVGWYRTVKNFHHAFFFLQFEPRVDKRTIATVPEG